MQFVRITHKVVAHNVQSLGRKVEVSFLNSKSSSHSSIRVNQAMARDPGHKELKNLSVGSKSYIESLFGSVVTRNRVWDITVTFKFFFLKQ